MALTVIYTVLNSRGPVLFGAHTEMPQPIKATQGLIARGGPKVILERPRLAALLGAITAVWGDVDNLFSDIFNLITFAKFIPVGAHSRSTLSSAVFDQSFTSYAAKIEVIKRVVAIRYPKKFHDEFDELTTDLRAKAKERNRLIHGAWQVCDKYPTDLIRIRDEKWIRYTERDFNDVLERSVLTRNALNDFFIKLSHTKGLEE